MGRDDLVNAMAAGFKSAGSSIQRALPNGQACDDHCNMELLQGIAKNLGDKALTAMKRKDMGLMQMQAR